MPAEGKFPLTHLAVAVSYHHGVNDDGNVFERTIKLDGSLNDLRRFQLMQVADVCPVGRLLSLNAEIPTHSDGVVRSEFAASYDDDLNELPIPYIDSD